jgi:uncharacterized spore protein YtfJ
MNNLNETIKSISDFLKSETKTETIIGQQFKLGEFSCLPVMSVGIGIGGAEGEGKVKQKREGEANGTGGAGGAGITPIGFLVTKGEKIEFIPTRTSRALNSAFEKIPELLEMYLEKTRNKEKHAEPA